MKTTNRIALNSIKRIFNNLFSGIFILGFTQPILSHGTVTNPPSRVWTCYQELLTNPQNPQPNSPACFASFMTYGGQAFYDWNEVARMDSNGMHRAVVPDGNLASAGRPDKYGGLDQVRDDWLATSVSPGPFTITWTNTAPHETLYYRVYVTNADWTTDQPLTWDSLELLVETDPRPSASTDNIDLVLPQRSGKHVLFSVWQRSLSEEAFYATIDVDFGSGIVVSVAPEADFTADNGICGGSEVLFDASSSFDANGDALTYSWDFGDGNTGEGVEVSHVFANGLDSSMVTLTVSDDEFSTGATQTVGLIKDENCSELVCSFDAPRENALPSANTSYDTVFVIGNRGPNLENISEFTINWDGTGLYQFDFNLSVSPHYVSLVNSTHTFGQSSPQITLVGSGIEGLDGEYFVTLDEGNFVLASIEGGYTIYFSQTDVAPECDDDVSVVTETLRGGSLPDNLDFEFIVNDGTADYVSGLTLQGNIGDTSQWLIADQSGTIIGLPSDIEAFDFDEIDGGDLTEQERLFVYNLSYNGAITGLNVGGSTITLGGEYELSNAVEVFVSLEEIVTTPGTNTCTFDTPRATPMPAINYNSYNKDQGGSITVIGENGPDLTPYRKLDIQYANGVIDTFFLNEWTADRGLGGNGNNVTPDIENTFNQANPELIISNSGIANFDGVYYVTTIDNDEAPQQKADFVMVSKTGGFTIYLTYSAEAPECDTTLSVEDNVVESSIVVQQNYPNPFSENTTIEYTLKQKSPVSLKIYTITGQLIKAINEDVQEVGNHKLTFDLANQTDGIYIYVFETENATYAKRMVLQK